MDFTAQRFKRFYIVNSNSDQGDITFKWKVLYYLWLSMSEPLYIPSDISVKVI